MGKKKKDKKIRVKPDFELSDHGTIFLLTPLSHAAHEWIDEKIAEGYQSFGLSVVVEHRYIRDIVAGICRDRLVVCQG